MEEGIYLLLRSPAYTEPRYFLLVSKDKKRGEDMKKMKESFEKAQREAKKKKTQLLIGGKPKKGDGDPKDGKKGRRATGEENVEMETIFHPAPVSGGQSKDMTTPERVFPVF